MNELTRVDRSAGVPMNWSKRQMFTMRQTVAKDTNNDEFELFIEYCRVKQLDPFSRQAIAIVFSKDDPKKRQMTIITTQDGLRVMAARCGDYRPAEDEPEYEYDQKLKGPTNPLGIVKCKVKLWKQDPKSTKWHPVNGTAYWNEYVPIKLDNDAYEWVETGEKWEDTGKPKKRKQLKKGADLAQHQTIEGLWEKMPRVMLAKCATVAALRGGWPTVFSGVYSEEEMERARVADLSASEMVEMEREERRAKAVGMTDDEYPFVDNQGNLTFIGAGQYGDKLIETAHSCKDTPQVKAMLLRNKEGFNRFWAHHKADALAIKRELEDIVDKMNVTEAA